jgi:hypothetical protein
MTATAWTRVPIDDVDLGRLEHLARQRGVTRAEIAAELISRALRDDVRALAIDLDPDDLAVLGDIAAATGRSKAEIVGRIVTRALEARRHKATRRTPTDPATTGA